MDIKVPRTEANEIAKNVDFDYAHDREYANLCTVFEELFGRCTNDIIVGGLNCQERGTPSMNVDLSIGLGYCKNTEKVAHTGSLFGPIAITNGGAQDRIDLVEVRLKETDYDEQQRAFKDPVTGDISYQDINVKTRFEIEAQVIEGTEGAGVAANHTAGWIKIAEVLVEAGENVSILDADIDNCTGGYDTEVTTNWTAETAVTFRVKEVAEIKKIFRVKHKENGDHVDSVIKDQHIDFGTGADQVSAIDVPVADAGSLIDATEIETALQEIAKERVPVGVVIPWLPGYFNSDQSAFTAVSISLEDNYKECNGAALNDAGSPIYNGAGRYLPKIDDSRFLMGTNTLSGDLRGGNNAMIHTHAHTHGAPNHTHTDNFSVDNHTLTIAQMPAHTHGPGDGQWFTCTDTGTNMDTWESGGSRTAEYPATTASTGGGNSHPHGLSGAVTSSGGSTTDSDSTAASNEENRPKYLSCKYIQRIK